MIEIDLEEIKKKTQRAPDRFANFANTYSWEEYWIKPEDNLNDTPLYNFQPEALIDKRVGGGNATRSACFGKFTKQYSIHFATGYRLLFTIYIYRVLHTEIDNNLCWMNYDQLRYWIDILKQEADLDFFYKIEEYEDYLYKVYFDFKTPLNRRKIKYILFWTRYAFELPAGYLALDALLLKRDYYPKESITNLLTLVANCNRCLALRMSPSQCITALGKFVSKKHLVSELNNKGFDSVQEIFGRSGFMGEAYNTVYGISLPTTDWCPLNNQRTCENWEHMEDRFKLYKELYPLFKETEIKGDKSPFIFLIYEW